MKNFRGFDIFYFLNIKNFSHKNCLHNLNLVIAPYKRRKGTFVHGILLNEKKKIEMQVCFTYASKVYTRALSYPFKYAHAEQISPKKRKEKRLLFSLKQIVKFVTISYNSPNITHKLNAIYKYLNAQHRNSFIALYTLCDQRIYLNSGKIYIQSLVQQSRRAVI